MGARGWNGRKPGVTRRNSTPGHDPVIAGHGLALRPALQGRHRVRHQRLAGRDAALADRDVGVAAKRGGARARRQPGRGRCRSARRHRRRGRCRRSASRDAEGAGLARGRQGAAGGVERTESGAGLAQRRRLRGAIGRLPRGMGGGERAAGTGAVVDDHALAETGASAPPRTRAAMSEDPPGGKATTMRMGREGHASAWAGCARTRESKAARSCRARLTRAIFLNHPRVSKGQASRTAPVTPGAGAGRSPWPDRPGEPPC